MSNRQKRVSRLERTAATMTGTRVVVPGRLAGWWRRYLDKTLSTAQAVTLATAVVTVTEEARQVSPQEDQAAQAVWQVLWDRAAGTDLDNMTAAFGVAGHWTQVLRPLE